MPPQRGRFRRGSSGKNRARSLPASRPTRAAPRRSPAFQIFTLRQSLPPPSPMDKAKESAAVGDSHRRLHISRLRTSPFQMTHAGFHRKTTQIRPQHQKSGDAKAPPPGTGPAHLCAAYSASARPMKAARILPRSRPCTATLAPQLCLPEGLRHTVFWKILPKSCLFLLHGAFSMYIFSRIKNKTSLRSKRNNVNERIGLITGMI